MYKLIKTDVLVVGGGGAGCRASIEAHDQGASVLMILKGELGQSGCTLNVGTSAAVGPWGLPEDNNFQSMNDLLEYGGFLGNQELAKILIDESPESVKELQNWGIDFARDTDGSITIGHSAAHTYPRNFFFNTKSPRDHEYGLPPGIAIMDTLVGQMEKRNIRVLENVMLVDLLKKDGHCVGAIGLNTVENKFIAFEATSTVLATGSYSRVFSHTSVSPHETGDGHAAAFRAGATLMDMENSQFVASSIGTPPGSKLLNVNGEEFLEKYGIKGMDSITAGGITKERLSYAVAKEIKSGLGTERQTILVDMTGVAFEERQAAIDQLLYQEDYSEQVSSAINENLKKGGSVYPGYVTDPIDLKSGIFETTPLAHTTTGGVKINESCESSVPGLYAAGAVAGGVYGHARPEGYTSMITLVFGKRAGLYAAMHSKTTDKKSIDNQLIQIHVNPLMNLIKNPWSLDSLSIKTRIQKAMKQHAWIIKSEKNLRDGLKVINTIREQQIASSANSQYETDQLDKCQWKVSIEVLNMIICSELMILSSIKREESRGAFFREEYPETDNKNWIKNITCRLVSGMPVLKTMPVRLNYCAPAKVCKPD